MATLPKVFTTGKNEPMGERTLLPNGKYIAEITKSEIKDNSKKTGTRLNFVFTIIEGEFKGKVVFVGLNHTNPNAECVEISMRELEAICQGSRIDGDIEDTAELHGIPMEITVGFEEGSGGYSDRNIIKKYTALEEEEENPFG